MMKATSIDYQQYLSSAGLGLWCSTPPLSTIVKLYRGGQFFWRRISEQPKKTTDLSQLIDKLYESCCIEQISSCVRFELVTFVVIDNDCIGSCQMNYHIISTTTVPFSSSNSLFSVNACLSHRKYFLQLSFQILIYYEKKDMQIAYRWENLQTLATVTLKAMKVMTIYE